MKIRSFFFVVTLGTAMAFSGCATPEARIKRNPEVFSGLAPSDQQLIREGKVALGFTPEMVKLALGDPDRVMSRSDASGSSEVWSYTTFESENGVYLYRGFYHRYWGDSFYPYYMSYPSRRQREYFKVTFAGGRVSVVEQET